MKLGIKSICLAIREDRLTWGGQGGAVDQVQLLQQCRKKGECLNYNKLKRGEERGLIAIVFPSAPHIPHLAALPQSVNFIHPQGRE